MRSLTYLSSIEECEQQWEQKGSCAVIAQCPLPSIEPLDAFLHLTDEGQKPFSFLLQSLQDGDRRGQQSIMGWQPDVVFTCTQEHGSFLNAELEEIAFSKNTQQEHNASPLVQMQDFLDQSVMPLPREVPSAIAGVFGYIGYDVVRLVEHLPPSPPSRTKMPDVVLTRPTLLLIYEHHKGCLFLAAPHYWNHRKDKIFTNTYRYAEAHLERIAATLLKLSPKTQKSHNHPVKELSAPAKITPTCNMSQKAYEHCFKHIQHCIEEGEIFQAVLAQRFSCPCPIAASAFYRELCYVNPSPYMFLFDTPWGKLIGSSPETFLSLTASGTLTIHPIAGTKRLPEKKKDIPLIQKALLTDPKERAEHLMLLDLARNDIGRISRSGSVTCPQTFQIQKTSHLLHITSVVKGHLKEGETALSALLKVLPVGTVSGAPKHRAMTIINSLEKERRTFYAGALGYFSADGSMDTCITLRTALLDNDGVMHVFAGSGIVKDSQMLNERKECQDKALVFFDTLKKITTHQDTRC